MESKWWWGFFPLIAAIGLFSLLLFTRKGKRLPKEKTLQEEEHNPVEEEAPPKTTVVMEPPSPEVDPNLTLAMAPIGMLLGTGDERETVVPGAYLLVPSSDPQEQRMSLSGVQTEDDRWNYLKARADQPTRVEWYVLTVRWHDAEENEEVVIPVGAGIDPEVIASYHRKSKVTLIQDQNVTRQFELQGVRPLIVTSSGKAREAEREVISRQQRYYQLFPYARARLPRVPPEMLSTLL